jgi:hypothetical protein
MEKEFKIIWLEVKSPEWKIATLADDQQQYPNVSINKVNKKGEVFPNFDAITNGGTVKGVMWPSPAGKLYLFAPKVGVAGQSGAFKGQQIAKAQEKKAEYIATAQDNKNEGIKIASTMSMAVNIVVATLKSESIIDEGVIKSEISKWRRWLWLEWDNVKDFPPFE